VTALTCNIGARMAILSLALSSLATSSSAQAQAVPKVGTCPSGYHTSGGACAPNSQERGARPAVAKIGSSLPATTLQAIIASPPATLRSTRFLKQDRARAGITRLEITAC
jgi:hypothetical protein